MKVATEEVVAAVARELAHGTDEQQGAFFNAFFSELNVGCKGKADGQLCYLSESLDRAGREGVKGLNEFVVLRDVEDAKRKASAVAS